MSEKRSSLCRYSAGFVLVCCLGFAMPATALAERYDDVSVHLEPIPQGSGRTGSTFGYLEYRIRITNHSPTQDHVVEVLLPKYTHRTTNVYISRLQKKVRVPASSSVLISVYQPPLPLGGHEMGVRIDGELQERGIGVLHIRHGWGSDYHYSYGSSGKFEKPVLVSRSVDTKFRDWMDTVNPEICCRAETPVSQWTTHWLGFSRFAGVVITAGDLRSMSAPTKRALRQYVECGGSLVLRGAETLPTEFTSSNAGTDVSESHPGFGHCLAADNHKSRDLRKKIVKMWKTTVKPWNKHYSVEEANRAFPVIETLNVPVRGMLVLMIVFAVVVGPLAIWLLGRWKKRMWLLWVIPTVSLLTCGGVFAYAAIAEGWRGQARTSVLTLLDETTNRAITLGWTAFYSPLTPRGGLTFRGDVELTPEIVGDSYYRSQGNRYLSIDWTKGQHLDTGWVAARVPSHFRVRKNELRRERLTVRKDDAGRLLVMNGLGADIQTLRLMEEDGKIWAGQSIPAGQEVPLEAMNETRRPKKTTSLRKVFSARWLGQFGHMEKKPTRHLLPNTYIAVLDQCPFLNQGLENLKQWKCRTVVYGFMKREP